MNDSNDTTLGIQRLRLVGRTAPKDIWDNIVGQPRLREFISKIVETVLQRGESFPHCIFTGPSGHGKTTIAEAVAKGLGNEFVSFVASQDFCRNDLAYLLSGAKPGTIIHVDEAHALQRCSMEFCYVAIDKGCIPSPGEKKPDVMNKRRLPDLTLIFSTNYPGKIPTPLRNRLTHLELDEYTQEDLKELGRRKLAREIEEQALTTLVESAQGNPRILIQSIKQLLLIDPGFGLVTQEKISELFKFKDIGPKGLGKLQQEYLFFLEGQPEQRSLVTSLCHELGIDATFLRREIEPFLIRSGFVAFGSPGRKLSKRGRRFILGELAAANLNKEGVASETSKNEN